MSAHSSTPLCFTACPLRQCGRCVKYHRPELCVDRTAAHGKVKVARKGAVVDELRQTLTKSTGKSGKLGIVRSAAAASYAASYASCSSSSAGSSVSSTLPPLPPLSVGSAYSNSNSSYIDITGASVLAEPSRGRTLVPMAYRQGQFVMPDPRYFVQSAARIYNNQVPALPSPCFDADSGDQTGRVR